MRYYYLLAFLFCSQLVWGQGLHVNWTRFIGPDSCCAVLNCAIPTKDGGIVFTGEADAVGSGDIPTSSFGGVLVGKLDSNRNLLWLHVYGGHSGQVICQTSDGGYAVIAYTGDLTLPNGLIAGYKGGGDIWLLKIDSLGNFIWGNCYGSGGGGEEPLSIAITKDNGFILFGISNGSGGDVPYHLGPNEFDYDWLVIKTDSLGNKQWVRDLGGSKDEDYYGAIVVADTGYYLFGASMSKDDNCIDTSWHSGVNTSYDYYVLKLSDSGSVKWSKSFGGTGVERAGNAIWDDRDSTIVATGLSSSTNFMVTGNHGANDMWTVKINKQGNLIWQKSLGSVYDDAGASISTLSGGGYLLLGSITNPSLITDNWMFVLNSSGNIISDTIFGGSQYEFASSIFPYSQGYISAGSSSSSGGFSEGKNFGTMGWGEKCTISYLSYNPNPNKVINQLSFNNKLLMYPNPAKGLVSINPPTDGRLTIFNRIGQLVYAENIGVVVNNINTSGWNPGIYIVQWQGIDGQMITNKLIIN